MVTSYSDHELILCVARRDIVAYRELVSRHLGRCMKVAERVLGNQQDAEDVVQEACLKIWNDADKWRPKAKFSTWLYKVIVNACLDRRRKIVPLAVADLEFVIDDKLGADEIMIEEERWVSVRNALQRLPDRQRVAVVLSYYEGLSNQEAADAMGVLLGAFQQLLFRAKQKLKEELIDSKNGG